MATKRFGDITRRAEAEVIARKREAMGKKEELRQEMQLGRREKRDARRAAWHERRERAMGLRQKLLPESAKCGWNGEKSVMQGVRYGMNAERGQWRL